MHYIKNIPLPPPRRETSDPRFQLKYYKDKPCNLCHNKFERFKPVVWLNNNLPNRKFDFKFPYHIACIPDKDYNKLMIVDRWFKAAVESGWNMIETLKQFEYITGHNDHFRMCLVCNDDVCVGEPIYWWKNHGITHQQCFIAGCKTSAEETEAQKRLLAKPKSTSIIDERKQDFWTQYENKEWKYR